MGGLLGHGGHQTLSRYRRPRTHTRWQGAVPGDWSVGVDVRRPVDGHGPPGPVRGDLAGHGEIQDLHGPDRLVLSRVGDATKQNGEILRLADAMADVTTEGLDRRVPGTRSDDDAIRRGAALFSALVILGGYGRLRFGELAGLWCNRIDASLPSRCRESRAKSARWTGSARIPSGGRKRRDPCDCRGQAVVSVVELMGLFSNPTAVP